MGKVPHSFVCLNTWSLAGGVILEGYGIFSNEALLEGSGPLGWALKFYHLYSYSVPSLLLQSNMTIWPPVPATMPSQP